MYEREKCMGGSSSERVAAEHSFGRSRGGVQPTLTKPVPAGCVAPSNRLSNLVGVALTGPLFHRRRPCLQHRCLTSSVCDLNPPTHWRSFHSIAFSSPTCAPLFPLLTFAPRTAYSPHWKLWLKRAGTRPPRSWSFDGR